MNLINVGRTTSLLVALILTACGDGASSTTPRNPAAETTCNPADRDTHEECGTLFVGLTDADGDFLNYTIDVLGLTLETADGRTVTVMPGSTRINFVDYVDATEMVSAAVVPPGTYVSGTIELDYTDAEVIVEADGVAKEAIVTDLDGQAMSRTMLRIELSNRDRLVVSRRRAHFLQLDFDLAASHTVNIDPTPARAASAQFISAEVHPVDEKEIRVRGSLVGVDAENMTYTIGIRPHFDRRGDFGRFEVHVEETSEFEVDGQVFEGAEGVAALESAGPGTPTVAFGKMTASTRTFLADRVFAGSSVPGAESDAVIGNIIKRDANLLTVRGATIVPHGEAADRRVHFHDDVVVSVGPETRVFKDGHPQAGELGVGALSVGQHVTIHGVQANATADAAAPQILFDATQGAVRMHVTRVAGIVNVAAPGQADITLHAIDRRRVEIFDFAGTGPSADLDADPSSYEVRTGNLTISSLAVGHPIVASGFPTAWGMSPPDFTGRSIVDYADVTSALGFGWGIAGTIAPFVSAEEAGLVLDNRNPDTDLRHHIKQGPVLIDLARLASNTTLRPPESGRMLFSIKTRDSLRLYSEWQDFLVDLNASLDGATAARSLYAYGHYDSGSNTVTARKLGIHLLKP